MAKTIIGDLIQIFKSSISVVLPENLIRNVLKYNPRNQQLSILNDNYSLNSKNVYLVGFGKAVKNMACEVETVLNLQIKNGIVSIPEGSLHEDVKHVKYYEGAKNNLPDINAMNTALKIKDLAVNLGKEDLLLVLISGGGSALLPLPKNHITLNEKTALIKKLAYSGANIQELNTVRKQISDLKGGKLAIYAQPAQVISLILSDIVNDPLDLIASGPTVENEDDINKAVDIIKKYKLFDNLPQTIKDVLYEYPNNELFPKDNVWNYIIGSNKMSIQAAENECKKLNYFPIALSNVVTGNITDIANEYTKLVKMFCDFMNTTVDVSVMKNKLATLKIPGITTEFLTQTSGPNDFIQMRDICLILGGEITVEVKGQGKGGRNQQLALEFSNLIHSMKHEIKDFDIFILSAGTDGIDGPTDAAGAIGYLEMVSDCERCNIDIDKFLKENDSYNFYKEFQNGKLHVITGHTNTNVMDIHLIIIKKKIH